MEITPIHTIVLYRKLHTDNICAVFLLQEFGEKHFPGISEAKVELWDKAPEGKTADDFEHEGILLVDMGGGKFDHHHEDHSEKTECASTLVAKYLGIAEMPALKKLLTFVKRDDLEGRGIVSKDVIDRMFGLPALILNLVRTYPEHPDYVIDIVKRIFQAHYFEQYRRTVVMPREWEDLKKMGKAEVQQVKAGSENLNVVFVETDSETIAGFLRAIEDVQADVVVVKKTCDHINIITKEHKPRLNLKESVREIRSAEAAKRNIDVSQLDQSELEKPGRVSLIPQWYYDTAANTLQNGGAAIKDIEPTKLALSEIKTILLDTLTRSLPRRS